ncbi:MAG TPA: SURF1 family protein [Pseudonocardiaceae bacterium]
MRLKVLLRPGWLALTVVVAAFATICFTLLAPWQYQRHEERVQLRDSVQAASTTAPVELSQLLAPDQAPDQNVEWRQVTLTGTYLPDAEVVVRLRSVQGKPAYEVLTPLRLADGSTALVNRGFVRPEEGTRVPDYPAPPTGTVTVTALVRADEGGNEQRQAFVQDGHRQVYSANSRTVAEAVGLDLRPGIFQLTADQPGVLNALPLPDLSLGPHLAYSLQWAAFGVMAIAGWCYYAYREIRPAEDHPERPGRRGRIDVAAALAAEEAAEEAAERAADTGRAERD